MPIQDYRVSFLKIGDCFQCGACHLLKPVEWGKKTFCNRRCLKTYQAFLIKTTRQSYLVERRRKILGITDAENDARHCRDAPAY